MRIILQPSPLPRTLFIRCDACKSGASKTDKGGVQMRFPERYCPNTETLLVAVMFGIEFKNWN